MTATPLAHINTLGLKSTLILRSASEAAKTLPAGDGVATLKGGTFDGEKSMRLAAKRVLIHK